MRWALILTISALIAFCTTLILWDMTSRGNTGAFIAEDIEIKARLPKINLKLYGFKNEIWADVSAYTKKETCPNKQCVNASGRNPINNLSIACPRRYKLGTKIFFNGNSYICDDRLSTKYDNRFDIWFGETGNDYQEAKIWGVKRLKIMYE